MYVVCCIRPRRLYPKLGSLAACEMGDRDRIERLFIVSLLFFLNFGICKDIACSKNDKNVKILNLSKVSESPRLMSLRIRTEGTSQVVQ